MISERDKYGQGRVSGTMPVARGEEWELVGAEQVWLMRLGSCLLQEFLTATLARRAFAASTASAARGAARVKPPYNRCRRRFPAYKRVKEEAPPPVECTLQFCAPAYAGRTAAVSQNPQRRDSGRPPTQHARVGQWTRNPALLDPAPPRGGFGFGSYCGGRVRHSCGIMCLKTSVVENHQNGLDDCMQSIIARRCRGPYRIYPGIQQRAFDYFGQRAEFYRCAAPSTMRQSRRSEPRHQRLW